MAQPKSVDPHLRRLEGIENNVRSFMEYMNKELDDMAKEFYGLKSQIAHLEKLIAEISDKQATLVNKMAVKPDFFMGIRMKI